MTTERPGHPHANSAVARFLDKRIHELRGVKTQREIAAEAGFARANVLSMLKSGETKLPLDRIPALAKALDADPAHMLRLGLRDLWPQLAGSIDIIFGRQLASKHEAEMFLYKWRAQTADMDPAPNLHIQAVLNRMFAELFQA